MLKALADFVNFDANRAFTIPGGSALRPPSRSCPASSFSLRLFTRYPALSREVPLALSAESSLLGTGCMHSQGLANEPCLLPFLPVHS